MKLEHYIRDGRGLKSRKYKTVNVDQDLHMFFKKTANHYNIPLSDLMFNILSAWKNKYQQSVKEDILKHLKDEG